jgi:hypothetical protein
MPLSRDAKGGGTNTDGSRSTEYCSHCYASGTFTMPNLTAAEMVARVKERLTSMNLPPPAIEKMADGIPSLRRWSGARA